MAKNKPLDIDIHPAPKPENTSHLRTLANGAVYDMVKKRIVANPGGGNKAFTSETASAALELRQQQKRNVLARAANAVAMQGGGVDGRSLSGDFAFVEAIGEAMTMKALSVNDPKAVDAARFIFSETGISEKQAQAEQAQAVNRDALLLALADLAGRLDTERQIVDADTIPVLLHDTETSDDDA